MNKAITSKSGKIVFKELNSPNLLSRCVVLDQKAFGLNYDDNLVLSGAIKNPNPHGILGIEAAGVVEFASRDCVRGFKTGDRVCYATYHPGAFVLKRAVHENYLIPIPSYLSFEASATLLKGLLAYTLLGKVFIIPSNAFIVLSGASGAVGSIVTQLASAAGLKVIALTSNDAKIDFIKSNGAFAVLNYKKQKVLSEVMKITSNIGADFFFDCLGKDVESFAFEILKVRGFFVQFGAITGEALGLNLLAQKQHSIISSRVLLANFISDYNNFVNTSIAYFKSIQAGIIRPHIQTFGFESAGEALREIKNATTWGQKVFLIK